jgi:FkbM family methyltransferase
MNVLRRCAHAARDLIPMKHRAFKALRGIWNPPKSVWQHLTFHGPIDVAVGRSSFRMHHFGAQVENSLFWTGYGAEWEGTSLLLWAHLCRRSRVILDVGANTGTYALAAGAINPSASIHAFEPIERIFQRLKRNVELNGREIGCHLVALSDRDGMLPMYDSRSVHEYSASFDASMFEGSDYVVRNVRAVRLDQFAQGIGAADLDLLKIDVERCEPAVLRGMARTFESGARPSIIIEVLDDEIGGEVQQIIDPLGYALYRIDELQVVRRIDALVGNSGGNLFLTKHPLPDAITHNELKNLVSQ